jgi:hypothetical protein
MWTVKNRGRYDRGKLRYPSDLTDSEWELVEPLIPPGKRGGGKRTVVMREVVNGLMYILSTGGRQAFRSRQGICGLAQTLDRRAHFRLAQSMSKARQGLGEPQSKSAPVLAPRLIPPHAQKTL